MEVVVEETAAEVGEAGVFPGLDRVRSTSKAGFPENLRHRSITGVTCSRWICILFASDLHVL